MILKQRRTTFLGWLQRSAASYISVMIIPHHDGKALSFRFSHLMLLFFVLMFILVIGFSFLSYFQQNRIEDLAENIEIKEKNNILVMAQYREKFFRINKILKEIEKINSDLLTIFSGGKKIERRPTGITSGTSPYANTLRLRILVDDATAYNKFISTYRSAFRNSPGGWPVSGHITSLFGYRMHPISRNYHFHRGIDIGARLDSPVYATGNGVVDKAGNQNSYGKFIIIKHRFGYRTLYAHNSRLFVRPGQKVLKGQVIARVGNSGLSTGSHIHYEIFAGNTSVNPIRYMSRWF